MHIPKLHYNRYFHLTRLVFWHFCMGRGRRNSPFSVKTSLTHECNYSLSERTHLLIDWFLLASSAKGSVWFLQLHAGPEPHYDCWTQQPAALISRSCIFQFPSVLEYKAGWLLVTFCWGESPLSWSSNSMTSNSPNLSYSTLVLTCSKGRRKTQNKARTSSQKTRFWSFWTNYYHIKFILSLDWTKNS